MGESGKDCEEISRYTGTRQPEQNLLPIFFKASISNALESALRKRPSLSR